MKLTHIWEQFTTAEAEDQIAEVSGLLNNGRYSRFNELLSQLKLELTAAEEEQLPTVKNWIDKGRRIVPEPGQISPSWAQVWDDYDKLIAFKEEALRAIPKERRNGEWQIVMDNPYTNDPVSCYPALSFVEAAYLYAYFRKDLKPNEYIRMQQVTELLKFGGN